MQNLGYSFILFVGMLMTILPWTCWDELIKRSWKTQGLIKLCGEQASRIMYSLIGILIVIGALLGLSGKL